MSGSGGDAHGDDHDHGATPPDRHNVNVGVGVGGDCSSGGAVAGRGTTTTTTDGCRGGGDRVAASAGADDGSGPGPGSGTGDGDALFDVSYDVVVVGAGLSGAVLAERHASTLNHKVLVLDRRPHAGGNCHDYVDEEAGGIRVCKYGAHLFHTDDERVWRYVNEFGKWTDYEHRVLARIADGERGGEGVVDANDNVDTAAVNGDGNGGGLHVPVPVNIDTVNALFGTSIQTASEMERWLSRERVDFPHPRNSEEVALSRVGPRLYRLLFEPYTLKQWDKSPADLGPEVLARIPVRTDRDDRYFSDKYQALPADGYSSIFENMLGHPNITVRLSTDYFDVRHLLKWRHRTYYTGPIDRYFASSGLPKLEYRSLTFERKIHYDISDGGYHQPAAVVNHPSPAVPYTRCVEYKHFLHQKSPHTVVFHERSCDDGEPYYPVPNDRNRELHRRYQELATVEEREHNVVFVGRLANYKYFNMDQAILNALEVFDDYVASLTEGKEEDEGRKAATTIDAAEENGVEMGG